MKLTKRMFEWLFRDEISGLRKEFETRYEIISTRYREARRILDLVDISVDVHESDKTRSRSWAVISLQGQKGSLVKFVDLGDSDILDIASFLRKYERSRGITIDASPEASGFFAAYLK